MLLLPAAVDRRLIPWSFIIRVCWGGRTHAHALSRRNRRRLGPPSHPFDGKGDLEAAILRIRLPSPPTFSFRFISDIVCVLGVMMNSLPEIPQLPLDMTVIL